MIPLGYVVDGIGGDDSVEGWQRQMIGDVSLEETKSSAGKVPLHSCAQRLQAGLVSIDGDDCRVWTRKVAECEREGAAAGAEVSPDAPTVPLDSGLDQLHVISVVHQMTPLERG